MSIVRPIRIIAAVFPLIRVNGGTTRGARLPSLFFFC
jgi:hypothetical protein